MIIIQAVLSIGSYEVFNTTRFSYSKVLEMTIAKY